MRFRSRILLLSGLALLCLALSGCGQKGPLVPPKSQTALQYITP